ncbi:MAG: tetratricopeptide repeat protein [Bacteroidota bacterium]
MKKTIVLLLCLGALWRPSLQAQAIETPDSLQYEIDSLQQLLAVAQHDTTRGWLSYELTHAHALFNQKKASAIAQECYAFASEALRRHPPGPVTVSLQRLKGRMSRFLGNIYSPYIPKDSLIGYFESCIAYSDSVGNTKDQSNCLRDLGKYMFLIGQKEKAPPYYERAMQLERETGDSMGLSISLMSLADQWRRHGQEDKAEEYFRQSIDIKFAIGDTKKANMLQNELGSICLKDGRYVEAAAYYFKTLELADSLGDEFGASYSYHCLARLYHRQEDYDKALKMSKRAMSIHKALNNPFPLSASYSMLGLLYGEMGQHDKSLVYYDSSLQIHTMHGATEQMAYVKVNKSAAYLRLGQLENARMVLEDLVRIVKTIKNPSVAVDVYINLGELYFLQGRYQQALAEAKRARDILQSSSSISSSRKVERLSSRIHEKLNNWSTALTHYKTYVALDDSITNIKAQRMAINQEADYKMKRLQDSTRFAFVIKEKEILAQEAQIENLYQRQKIKNGTIVGLLLISVLLLSSIFLWIKSYQKEQQLKASALEQNINLQMKEIDHLQASLKSHLEERTVLTSNILDGSINQYLSDPLTKRELEVLEELTKGNNNNAIAKNLFVSVNTVRTHLGKIYEKLGVDNRLQAVNKASNIQRELRTKA